MPFSIAMLVYQRVPIFINVPVIPIFIYQNSLSARRPQCWTTRINPAIESNSEVGPSTGGSCLMIAPDIGSSGCGPENWLKPPENGQEIMGT